MRHADDCRDGALPQAPTEASSIDAGAAGSFHDFEHGLSDEALANCYRTIFDALDQAFCVIETVHDEEGRPVDLRLVEANHALEVHSGLPRIPGASVLGVIPDLEPYWIDTFAGVVASGKPVRFMHEVKPLGRCFDVYAWRLGAPERRRLGVHFANITERQQADGELRYRNEQFQSLIQQAPLGIYLLDAELRVVEANPIALRTLGDTSDVIGRSYEAILRSAWPQPLVDEVLLVIRQTLQSGVTYHQPELAEVRADRGVTEYYDWRIERIRLPDGSHGVVCYFSDISTLIQARDALAASEHRYRTLFESIDEGFCIMQMIFDDGERPVDYRFIEVNPAFERHTGLEGVSGRTIRQLVPDLDQFWFDAYAGIALTGDARRFSGQVASLGRWFDVYAFRIGEPHERRVAALFTDITARKRAQDALQENVALLRHHVHHDALTGLPNRILLEDRLQSAVAAAERHARTFAVLFIDLDDFKTVNDQLGHASGDVVLTEVARRLRRSLRASDTLARMHGDEFVALLTELSEEGEAQSVARVLLDIISDPIDVAGTVVSVHASIGVSLHPRDGANPWALLQAADDAMYQVKLGGKNAVGSSIAPSGQARLFDEPG